MQAKYLRRVPQPLRPAAVGRGGRARRLLPAGRRLARDAVPAGAAQGAGRLPAAAPRKAAAAAEGARRRLRQPPTPRAAATRPPRRRWSSWTCSAGCCTTRSWASGSCRSSPTRRAPSAWTRSSPRQHLFQRRPALRAGRCRVRGHGLPRGEERPDSGRGHHRGRLDVVVHRGRHGLRHPRPADDPVLHLLLDVRLPAHRRPDLGGGRLAGARLPAGGDRRPDDAQRRGLAARGRPQPRPGLDGAERGRLRPGLRLRAGRHHPRRHPPHVRRQAGGHLLLHHAVQRKLPDAADAGRRGRGHPARGCTSCGRRPSPRAKVQPKAPPARQRPDPAARPARRRRCWRSSTAWRPTSGA